MWHQHVQTLANPAFAGRAPGTRGIAWAADYIEFYFRQFGLAPGFGETYRQAVPLETASKSGARGRLAIGAELLINGTDFVVTANSPDKTVNGPLTFVGYAVESGDGDYSSFDDPTDLTGRLAVMFRLEPLNEDGAFRHGDGPSGASSMANKLAAVARRGAAGVLVVNPPGAALGLAELDPLSSPSGCCSNTLPKIPAAMITPTVADRLLRLADSQGRSLLDWRRLADNGTVRSVHLNDGIIVTIGPDVRTETVVTENVAGVLPGRGRLAGEWIVLGGHYDHVGRAAAPDGTDHVLLGADDNASGTAGVLLLASRLAEAYAAAPRDASLRSIIFVAFTAEEVGLIGSRHFVQNPPFPLDRVRAMLNLDMIGRLREQRLWLYGFGTAAEYASLLSATLEQSELDVSTEAGSHSSDQVSFEEVGIPVLYATTGGHEDVHTPDDVASAVNPAGAAAVLTLIEQITTKLVAHSGTLSFVKQDTKGACCAGAGSAGADVKPQSGCCGRSPSTAPKSGKSNCCG